MLELYVVVADCATSYEPGGGAFVQPTALVLPSWHQVTDGVKNAEVLAVKGPLRRFAPLTAPGRCEGRSGYQGKGACGHARPMSRSRWSRLNLRTMNSQCWQLNKKRRRFFL